MSDTALILGEHGPSFAELKLCMRADEVLKRHYPGHLWAMNVTESVMWIRCLHWSGNYGMPMKIPAMYSSSDWDKQVMLKGGEILEHFDQKRGRFDEAAFVNHPVDFAGRHKMSL